ncbi:MAG: hypothetical protein RLZZ450_2797 [Pseudomonadota bacterium]|jgi:PAS domain S-box-containing protein
MSNQREPQDASQLERGRPSVFPQGPINTAWVLEDSPQQALVIREALAPLLAVRVFHDSPQLLEALTGAQPDVLILDWHVPEISGREVLQVVRDAHDEVTLPVLIVTGSRSDMLEALATGANDYATKPFVPAELRARVSTLVRVRSLHGRALRAERELRLAVTREAAARAEAESDREKLAASEERLRRVVEASGAGLWEIDMVSGAVVADARMVELMAFRGAVPMTFESGLASVHEDDAPHLSAAVQAAVRGQDGGRYQVEFRTGGTGDTPLRWVESRAQASFDESGRATRLAGAIVDVTARKEAELAREVLLEREVQARERLTVLSEESKASETRLRLLTDALPVLVSFVTADERYGFVNKGYQEWFGRDLPELIGHSVREVVGESAYAVLRPFIVRGLAGERVSFEQHGVPYQAGGARDIRANFVPLQMGAEPGGYVALLEDITAQRALEAERERLAAQRSEVLERQAQFEKQLIGIVSHDLRTPLNVISLSSARLARDDELSAGATKNVVRIQNAVHRAVRLVADLLDFTQARLGGGIPIERRATDLHALLDSLVTELEAAFPERRVECVHEGEGQGAWDPERITQLAQNLITNALKYSPEDSVVKVSTQRAADAILLRVHNLGAPIPTAQLTVIFEPLQRGHEQIDRVTRSVGLGLYIVKQIVEAHRGAVQVESSQDQGTTFVVSLPLA